MLLILNRYKCPINGNVTSQAHLVNADFELESSFPKMQGDDLNLFQNYDNILIVDVIRSSNLASINLVKNK